MNCEECSGFLVDYLEDLLGPKESGAVKEHLDSCPDCSLELENYREIRMAAREEALPEVSADVLSSISEAARENASQKKTPFWKKWSYSPILVPTISAAIALSVWFYYGHTGFEGVDTVTREVGAVKMRASEKQEEAFSDTEEKELYLASEDKDFSGVDIDTVESDDRKKPAGESRILPASPAETQTSENAPAKGVLRKKDVTEEDLIQYRKGGSSSSELLEQGSIEENPVTTSGEGASESLLRAKQPMLRDYTGELELAQRQQAEGNCEASITTNEALLNSSPPPPQDVQAGSYKSLGECYEKTGDLGKAVSSYKKLSLLDPTQSRFVNEKLEEIKIDAAYMNYEGSDTDTEPAN
jgi:tetratricopeptide (TPR) repeat protein